MTYKVEIKGGGGFVRFEASSPISESRVANYDGFNIVHLPTSIWAYRNTNGRHFSINGKLVSRTVGEAKANAGYLTTIRSWVLPGFGTTGSTPPIVFLTAYGNKQIKSVPCVVLSYSWSFPDDVDYIFDAPEPMPVIGTISVELEEAYNAEQITRGAWKIAPQSDGEFSYVGTVGSSSTNTSINTTLPYSEDFGGLASSTIVGSLTLGNALSSNQLGVSSISDLPLTNLAESLNSSEISTETQDNLSLNNRFITGFTSDIISRNSLITIPVTQPPLTISNDSFGRSSELTIPTFGE